MAYRLARSADSTRSCLTRLLRSTRMEPYSTELPSGARYTFGHAGRCVRVRGVGLAFSRRRPLQDGPLQPQPCPRPHLEDLAVRGAEEGDGVAVFSGHRHSGQVQASALQHGLGCESLAAAQWVGQMLRATQEALTGALWTAAPTVGTDTVTCCRGLSALRPPALCGPSRIPKNEGHTGRDLLAGRSERVRWHPHVCKGSRQPS